METKGTPIQAYDKVGRRIETGDEVAFVNENRNLEKGTVTAIIGKYIDNTPFGNLRNITYRNTYRQDENQVDIEPDETVLQIDRGDYCPQQYVSTENVYKLM